MYMRSADPLEVLFHLFNTINRTVLLTWKAKHLGHVKRIWYLSLMRAAKVQASLRIRAVSPEPPLLAHTSSESRGTFRQKARSLVPLNGWACAVKICHDGMLEDTNSLDGAHLFKTAKKKKKKKKNSCITSIAIVMYLLRIGPLCFFKSQFFPLLLVTLPW